MNEILLYCASDSKIIVIESEIVFHFLPRLRMAFDFWKSKFHIRLNGGLTRSTSKQDWNLDLHLTHSNENKTMCREKQVFPSPTFQLLKIYRLRYTRVTLVEMDYYVSISLLVDTVVKRILRPLFTTNLSPDSMLWNVHAHALTTIEANPRERSWHPGRENVA